MPYAELLAAIMVVAMIVYSITGGADFGGGVWILFAPEGRRADHERLITKAIAPIWEANHVWLIAVVVILFVCFPPVFSTVLIDLHIPVTLMLIGIVLRGSAFVFQSFEGQSPQVRHRWSRVFALASLFSPYMLGVVGGAVATGRLRLDPTGRTAADFFTSWIGVFPLACGLFILALFSWLAALYLVYEAKEEALRSEFRRRALIAGGASGLLGAITLILARTSAPKLWEGLTASWFSPLLLAALTLTGLGALAATGKCKDQLARLLGAANITLVVGGWGTAQYPYLVYPDLTISGSAAPASVLAPVFFTLLIGLIVIAPAFVYLYRVFKSES